jgi:hypothetical protein
MDQSDVDIPPHLPQGGRRKQASRALARVVDAAIDPSLLRRARRAIARLGTERLRESYFTTFWLQRGARPSHAIEEAVLALWKLAAPGESVSGAEWWVGRSYTTVVPIGFHFDQDVKQDVKARRGLTHPLLSSVLFFNSVRGGQLAITDQVPGRGGRPAPAEPTRLQAVKPRANRYAIFRGDLLHGVLDADGNTPGPRALAGPRGRLRVTLVVNYWARRPTAVPAWSESRVYPSLRQVPRKT